MNLAEQISGLLEAESSVDWYVQKALDKAMHELPDKELRDWLDVPELDKKEQKIAFEKIRKAKKR